MSNGKLKETLEAKLERQKKALEDTRAQLDWVLEQEAKASKGPASRTT